MLGICWEQILEFLPQTTPKKLKQYISIPLLFTPQDLGQYNSIAENLRVSDTLTGLRKQKERKKQKGKEKKKLRIIKAAKM